MLEKVSPSNDAHYFSAQSLGEEEQLQQLLLGKARFDLGREKDPYVTPLIIGTVPGGALRLLDYNDFEELSLSRKDTLDELGVLSRYYEYEEMQAAYVGKANSSVGTLKRKLEGIESKIKACYESLSEPVDHDGYIPLDATFSSPSPRPMSDLPGQSTRATGPPSSSAATEAHAQVHAQIAELEKEKGEILSRISESAANLKIDLHKLKSSSRFTMLKNDYLVDTDLIKQVYKESMMGFYETLSTALGVSEFSKLAAAASAVHDLPSVQASKMWGWIVRSSSRRDQAFFNSRFKNRNPFDTTRPPASF